MVSRRIGLSSVVFVRHRGDATGWVDDIVTFTTSFLQADDWFHGVNHVHSAHDVRTFALILLSYCVGTESQFVAADFFDVDFTRTDKFGGHGLDVAFVFGAKAAVIHAGGEIILRTEGEGSLDGDVIVGGSLERARRARVILNNDDAGLGLGAETEVILAFVREHICTNDGQIDDSAVHLNMIINVALRVPLLGFITAMKLVVLALSTGIDVFLGFVMGRVNTNGAVANNVNNRGAGLVAVEVVLLVAGEARFGQYSMTCLVPSFLAYPPAIAVVLRLSGLSTVARLGAPAPLASPLEKENPS